MMWETYRRLYMLDITRKQRQLQREVAHFTAGYHTIPNRMFAPRKGSCLYASYLGYCGAIIELENSPENSECLPLLPHYLYQVIL
jgi:hypothetical protein